MLKFSFQRAEFYDRFKAELQKGRVVVAAWCDDLDGRGWVSLVLGGEDRLAVEGLMERVKRMEEEVSRMGKGEREAAETSLTFFG